MKVFDVARKDQIHKKRRNVVKLIGVIIVLIFESFNTFDDTYGGNINNNSVRILFFVCPTYFYIFLFYISIWRGRGFIGALEVLFKILYQGLNLAPFFSQHTQRVRIDRDRIF